MNETKNKLAKPRPGILQGASSTETFPIRQTPLEAIWTRCRALFASVSVQRKQRKLRLCESLSLGDKRLVAVLEFEEQRFLVAVTSQSISLLQSLGPARAEEKTPADC